MFESNFPVDRQTLPYSVLWNTFQRIADQYSHEEKSALFSGQQALSINLDRKLLFDT